MLKIVVAFLTLSISLGLAQAQDIAGVENCTKAAGLDKRTSCLQSNINFLHQLATRNALETTQQLTAARNEIIALKSAVAGLQATVAQLQSAQKAPPEKKPETK